MAKEIRQWKTDDGKIFATLEEAEIYESKQKEIANLSILMDTDEKLTSSSVFQALKQQVIQLLINNKRELLDTLYLKGKFKDVAFTRKDLLETAGLPPEKSKNGKTDPELKIKQPVQSSSSKSRTPVKLVRPEVLSGK